MAPPEVIERLQATDWDQVFPDLVAYAKWRSAKLPFVKGGGELPKGNEPEDLAREAMTLVYEGKRQWNPAKNPDLPEYLSGVVSSLVSNLAKSADHKRRDADIDGEAVDLDGFVNTDGHSPHELAASAQCEEVLRRIVDDATSDDPNLAIVAMGLEDGMRPAEIAKAFSIKVGGVYQLAQKLRRRLLSRMSDHECWKDHPVISTAIAIRR